MPAALRGSSIDSPSSFIISPSSLACSVFPPYHLVTAMPHTTTQRPNRCDIDLRRLELDYTPGLFKPFKHAKTNPAPVSLSY